MVSDIDGQGSGKTVLGGKPVVKQKRGTEQPWRAFVRMRRDREPHWSHQMRREFEPDVALGELPAHAKKAPALQYREIAMDQPGCRRGSGGAEIALLNQDHPQATAGGVACDADAVEPAADHRKIVVRHAPSLDVTS